MKYAETGGVITRIWERLGDFAQMCTIYKWETAGWSPQHAAGATLIKAHCDRQLGVAITEVTNVTQCYLLM